MKTIRTKVYLFNELNDKAKEAAVNELREINVFYDWWSDTYNDAENIGLKITSFDINRNKYCKGEFILSACEVAANILKEHGDTCNTYNTATQFLDEWQPIFNNYMDENHKDYESAESECKLIDMEDHFLNSLLEDYSTILQNESEYLLSDESVISTIEANEYYFLQNGKQFPNN